MEAIGYNENASTIVSPIFGLNSGYTLDSYSDTKAHINVLENGISINTENVDNNAFRGVFSPAIDVSNYTKLRVSFSCASVNNYIYVGLSSTKHTDYINYPDQNTDFC